MLHTVLEQAERAIIEVEQHAHTVGLLVGACFIVGVVLAVAEERTGVGVDEPAVGAVPAIAKL
jgi:hypothetical protein